MLLRWKTTWWKYRRQGVDATRTPLCRSIYTTRATCICTWTRFGNFHATVAEQAQLVERRRPSSTVLVSRVPSDPRVIVDPLRLFTCVCPRWRALLACPYLAHQAPYRSTSSPASPRSSPVYPPPTHHTYSAVRPTSPPIVFRYVLSGDRAPGSPRPIHDLILPA